ncbi:MAG TPA: DNA polymerase III subunit gamma/tau [Solirubrobacterales bacterium]|nr:DNA polymerase III subunit gamma/tau [Solirubrobacterales bacterium]
MTPETSLYRRHRPRSFDEVVGQEHVVRTLRNAVDRDRVHHAYLFVGSRGTGKTSMAKILAGCLNCRRGPTTSPCGECESCVTIAAGTSLDVIEMDAASNRSVDDIRDLRERVGYLPAAGRWKVYIIDEAHMLTREAWNAFLKTLEEPPPNTVFVLATTEAHKVMPTIVDRCQRFDFQRPSLPQITEVLTRVTAAEEIEIDDGAIGAIARAANGSFRDALGTLDQLVAYGGARVATEDVLSVLGVADADLIFAAGDAIASEDGRAALEATGRLAQSGRDPSQFCRDLVAHLRQLLVVRTAGTVPDAFSVTAAQEERLREQAERLGDQTLVRAIDELSAALSAIREGDDAHMALELAVLRAARPDLDPSREALAQRVERLERRLAAGGPAAPAGSGSAPVEPPDPEEVRARAVSDSPSEPAGGEDAAGDDRGGAAAAGGATVTAAVEAIDIERITGLWPAVVDQVRQSGSELLSTVYEAARPLAVDAEQAVLKIGFPPSAAFNKRKAEAQANRERFAEAVRTIVGESLRPVYVLLDGEPEEEEANGGAALSEDELIERIRSEFDAEFVEAEAEPEAAKDESE